MSCKHVDIIAVAILLVAMALCSTTRHAIPLAIFHDRIVVKHFDRSLVRVPKPPYITLAFK